MTGEYSEKLGNKYTLLDLIGTGGMAEVYKGRLSGAEGFEKLVVIKRLIGGASKDKEIISHFISEAKLSALLQHENIAQTYDFGELDGSYFIAMEYLSGKDLHSVLQRGRELGAPMAIAQALFVTAKICEGMEYAHSLKDFRQQPLHIIHRDLSPHNVFITYEGKVKVIDFGIARAELFDNKTKAGIAKGKISYMSPEQLTAGQIDHRSDIFSIGILLYEMLCGTRMYSGDTATVIRKCMTAEYAKPEDLRPGLPPAIYRILDKALEKDVTLRYQTCALMLTDVEECLFGIRKRPSAQLLEEYMRQLFTHEMAAEKNAAAREGTARLQAQKGESTASTVIFHTASYAQALTEQTDVDEAVGEKTEIAQLAPLAPNSAGTTAALKKPPRRRLVRILLLGVGGIFGLLLAGIIFFISQIDKDQDNGMADISPLPPAVSPPAEEPPRPSPPKVPTTEHPPQEEVGKLLDEAAQILSNKRATSSDLETALRLYAKVQEKEPDNMEARAGINRIGEHYRNEEEQTLNIGNFSQASKNVRSGLFLPPKDGQFLALQGTLASQRQKTIQGLTDKAEQALNNNNLTTPADDNAYKYYREILELEQQNAAALKGLEKIADRFADLAEDAYRAMKIRRAREYVQQGLTVDPHHEHLLQLQDDLQKSKSGMFLKSIEKSFATMFR